MTTTKLPSGQFYPSSFAAVDAATYKASLDANSAVNSRIGSQFSVQELPTPAMKVAVMPGHLLNGTTLTEVGCWLMATLAASTVTFTVPTASESAISNGMIIYDPYLGTIASGTTVTISGATVTMSAYAGAGFASSLIYIAQVTGAITAPVTHPRIDRIVCDQTTGVISVITGSESTTPTPPAITVGKYPLAQILLQTTTTTITNDMITDERDFTSPPSPDPQFQYVAVTSTYNILTTDFIIEATSGTFTATFPDFTTVGSSVRAKPFTLKNSGSGVVTWATTSAQTIDGATTGTLGQYQSMTIYATGTTNAIITA